MRNQEFLPDDKEKSKRTSDLELLQKLIEDGFTDEEIVRLYPKFSFHIKQIDELRYTLQFTKYKTIIRNDIKVFYIYGKTGTGKSRFVHENFDPKDIYVVSDYEHPFDNYAGQRIIIFDEFRGQIKYSDMLQLLDRYPCQLSARYGNKWACYHLIFIISNIPLDDQYRNVFVDENSRDAFYRRINGGIIEFEKKQNLPYKDFIYTKTFYANNDEFNAGIPSDLPDFNDQNKSNTAIKTNQINNEEIIGGFQTSIDFPGEAVNRNNLNYELRKENIKNEKQYNLERKICFSS